MNTANVQNSCFALFCTSAVLPAIEIGTVDLAAVAISSLNAPSTADVFALKLNLAIPLPHLQTLEVDPTIADPPATLFQQQGARIVGRAIAPQPCETVSAKQMLVTLCTFYHD